MDGRAKTSTIGLTIENEYTLGVIEIRLSRVPDDLIDATLATIMASATSLATVAPEKVPAVATELLDNVQLRATADAGKSAEAFQAELNATVDAGGFMTEGTMIGWFANAIEAGRIHLPLADTEVHVRVPNGTHIQRTTAEDCSVCSLVRVGAI